MPPKRKAAEAAPAETSTRATRSSARSAKMDASDAVAAVAAPSRSSKRTAKAAAISDGEAEAEAPPKKAKVAKASAAKAKATKAAKTSATKAASNKKKPSDTAVDGAEVADEPVKPIQKSDVKKPATKTDKPEPYSASAAGALFQAYADPDEPATIGAEGFERLCTDANIPLDGAMPLLLAWQLDAKEMGKISKEDWVRGTDALHVSSLAMLALALSDLHALLILNEPSPAPSITTSTPAKKKKGSAEAPAKTSYNRTRYQRYAADPNKAFGELYAFCFVLAKPEGSRNIDMDTATALWGVVLNPRYPQITDVIAYITEAGTYKGVNKDLWSMMLEFCKGVKPDLSDYEADGAWPTLVDDFVSWKKAKDANGNPAEPMAE